MHHFALWAAYPERGREGEKFVVAERRLRTAKRGVVGDAPEEVRARRAEVAVRLLPIRSRSRVDRRFLRRSFLSRVMSLITFIRSL